MATTNIRCPLIAGNWKLNKTNNEAIQMVKDLIENVKDIPDNKTEILVAPPFTALSAVYQTIKDSSVKLGAQNLFWEDNGAFTGEISASMLVSAGCEYVIIGHSERRQFFHETNQTVNKRISAALKGQLKPVFCIGETEQERESGKTMDILTLQITEGLDGIDEKDLMNNMVIAYEPVWAIGTGKTANNEQVQEVHHFLRALIEKIYGNPLANSTRILYGGSVKPQNIGGLMALADVDGALVGGASLDPQVFSDIIHY